MSEDYFEEQHHLVSLVYFSVGDLMLATKNNRIEQVIYLEEYRRLSKSVDFIEGILNLGNEIVILTDLRNVLKTEAKEKEEPMVIIYRVKNALIGFIVDCVTRVSQLNTKAFRPAPPIQIEGIQDGCLYGIISEDDKNVLLIDLEKIFSANEFRLLNQMSAEG